MHALKKKGDRTVKLFHLYRVEDQSGVSGTGPVVEGVEFTNGWCALRWVTGSSTICFYQSLAEVEAIHGHGGKTELIVHDFEPLSRKPGGENAQRFDLLLQIFDEASRAATLGEDSDKHHDAHLSIQRLKQLVADLEANLFSPERVA